jgi:hypothetical protein
LKFPLSLARERTTTISLGSFFAKVGRGTPSRAALGLVSAFELLVMSRLSEELRERIKKSASPVIRLYVKLPRQRKEVDVLGNQLLRSRTSVAF